MAHATRMGTNRYDALLGKYATSFQSQKYKFIYDKLMGQVVVDKETGYFANFSAKGMYDIVDSSRAPGTKANEIDNLAFTSTVYATSPKALKSRVLYNDIRNEAQVVKEKFRKTERLLESLYLGLEKDVANLVFTAGNFGSNTAASGAKWDVGDYETNDPRAEVSAKMIAISKNCGIRPNVMVINEDVAEGLARSAQVAAFMPDNIYRDVTEAVLAKFFRIDNVLIGSSAYNTANESQTKVMSGIWGKHCLLAYVDKTASINDPSFAKTFIWNGSGNFKTENRGSLGVSTFTDSQRDLDYIQVEMNYDNKISMVDSAFLITDIIS